MANIKVCLSVDKELKEESTVILQEMGLSFSGGIELFLRAVVREEALPFPVTTKPIGKPDTKNNPATE